ncbi:MAG TPA: DUF2231 domain-containing protein [Wenzhouxiangella sp.]|nr:DUF2231 domain-containing protein [Wenzhouxiangella sp.]
MQNLKVGGVPLHTALVHFPVVFWSLAMATDIAGLLTQSDIWWTVSWWSLAAGLVAGLAAAAVGFVDFVLLGRARHPAVGHVQNHMLVMLCAWAVFLVDLLVRDMHHPSALSPWAVAVTALGFVLLAIGAHLGGRLVYRHRVGID